MRKPTVGLIWANLGHLWQLLFPARRPPSPRYHIPE